MMRCTILFLGCVVVAQGGWQLTFADEFNGQTLINSSAWVTAYSFAPVTINDELQFYSPGGFTFGSDYLRIVGEQKSVYGFDYQSGVITTNGRFTQAFGYFEMRARWMSGRGLWPAFWLLGQYENAGVTEIDILEALLQNPETAYMTYHCNNKSETAGSEYTGDELADQDWHTYSVQWNPDIIIWYIDGIQRFNTTMCVPTYPMYMLANMAIGGSWPGPPNATTPFPAYMDIDYIHAYQYVDSGGVSLDGPGEGLAFTMPTLPALPVVTFGGPPSVTPNDADRGDNVTFTFTFNVGEDGLTTPVIGLYVQDWMTTNGSSVITNTINLDSLVPGTTRTVSFTETIPDTLEDGYYRVIFGVFNNGGEDGAFWQDCVAELGINSIVGGREIPTPETIPSTVEPKSPSSSSEASTAEFGCFILVAVGILV